MTVAVSGWVPKVCSLHQVVAESKKGAQLEGYGADPNFSHAKQSHSTRETVEIHTAAHVL